MKSYDLFISYSHSDRPLVKRLVEALSRRGIRCWWDTWEMKPGDVLRERVNEGVENASHYIVVASRDSLASTWVQHELNAAFLRQLEGTGIKIIPALAPDCDFSDLPIDLRMRFGVSLRDSAAFADAIVKIEHSIQPSHRLRAERLRMLRNPRAASVGIADYTEALLEHDLQLHHAAISGLAKMQTQRATVLCGARSANMWGCGPIEASIKALGGPLAKSGGVLALSSLVFYDSRYISHRLGAIATALRREGPDDRGAALVDEAIAAHGSILTAQSWVPVVISILTSVGNDDVQMGLRFMRDKAHGMPMLRSLGLLDPSPPDSMVKEYYEERCPGLYDGLLGEMRNSWKFPDEAGDD
nr:toll/interleukin-1 receptor domain-containing protein [Propionibacterium sp.]